MHVWKHVFVVFVIFTSFVVKVTWAAPRAVGKAVNVAHEEDALQYLEEAPLRKQLLLSRAFN